MRQDSERVKIRRPFLAIRNFKDSSRNIKYIIGK